MINPIKRITTMTEWKFRVSHNARREAPNYKQGCYADLGDANEVFDGILEELEGESFTITLEEVDKDWMGCLYPVRTIRKEIRN